MKKILITGADGMLAHDFIQSQKNKFQIIGFDKSVLDITVLHNIDTIVQNVKPDIILNCAAYLNAEKAEKEEKKRNFDVNALGVFNLATIAKKYQKDFITLSTDYVFDGQKRNGYNETDIQNPLNNYGLAKYLGEKLATEIYSNTLIIRTSWLYGGGKNYDNFVNTIVGLLNNEKEIKIVNNQFGSPTYTMDLSMAIGEIISNIEFLRGKIFHLSNDISNNGISWFDFADRICKIKKKGAQLVPCSSEEYESGDISRPKFSKLNNNSSFLLRNWEEGLKEYLKRLE
ncbi:MAG: dTDP-4-dehydrorhamnose reductase [Candidatus Gracilibacteria bacterium]|nr:dTDP-4-dehydrorhamnose reductase [Candidatus Gracilibacteria bacterium]